MSKETKLLHVPLNQIRTNPVALRAVEKDGEDYIHLRDSIEQHGILNAISVREKQDEETGDTYYEILEGLHRYTACCDCGLTSIPAQVVDKPNDEVEILQIVANLVRVDTTPIQYTKQLHRYLASSPTLTVAEIASSVSQSPSWVNQRLGLLKLEEEIQALVDDGKISVSNAIALSKLPKNEQVQFVDSAMTEKAAEFVPMVEARVKELRTAAREGKAAQAVTFSPTAHLRKVSEFKSEMEVPTCGPAVCAKADAQTAAEGFAAGVQWGLSLDSEAVEAQEAKYTARLQKREDDKKRREAERARKKSEEAAAAQQKAEAALTV